MAEAKREYQAIFAIGAKLLGSFGGAIGAARARLRTLQVAAGKVAFAIGRSIGAAIRKMALLFSGVFAGIAAFGAAKILANVFKDASKEIEEAHDRARKLTGALMQQQFIRKKGIDYAKELQVKLADHNTTLAKTGLIAADTLDTMGAQLAVAGVPARSIAQAMEPMADMLVTMKGVHATEEDGAQMAKAWGNAIKTGMVKPLKEFGIILSPAKQKAFREIVKTGNMKKAHEYLLKIAKGYKGANQEALKTPEGQIVKMTEDLGEMAERIGEKVLPARGKMAEMWRSLIPEIEPYLQKFQELGINAQLRIAEFVKTTLMPALKRFTAWVKGPLTTVWDTVSAKWNYMISMVGPAFLKMFQSLGGEGKTFEQIMGETVIAALEKLGDLMVWIGDNADWLAPFVTTLAAAFVACSIAISAMNLVLAVTPIGWIIIGIGALIAALVLLLKYPKQISEGATQMWDKFSQMGVLGSILKLAFLPLYQLVKVITWLAQVDWMGIWQGLIDSWDTIKDLWGKLMDFFIDTWNKFTKWITDFKVPKWLQTIAGGVGGLVSGTSNLIGKAYGGVKGWMGGGGGSSGAATAAAVAGGPAGVVAGGPGSTVALPPESLKAVQQERAEITADLMRPELRNLVSATLATEAGTAEGQKNVLESMVNRSVAYKRAGKPWNAEAMIKGGFYGPYNRGETGAVMGRGLSDERSQQVAGMIGEVGGGRNAMRGMTDQGMVNEIVGYKEKINGEYYGFMQGVAEQYKTAAFTLSRVQPAAEGAAAVAAVPAAPEAPPALARGGIVSKPTIAQIGESGPEAVMPLHSRIWQGMKAAASPTTLHFTPSITINGNATEEDQRAMDSRLRDMASDFIDQFKRAQGQERRLSYNGGYA